MTIEEKKAELHEWLQAALQLELATIPPYLIALLSIKLPGNREPAELIRSVMIEEMLHFALVANVLNAVGGTPRLSRETLPSYPLTLSFKEQPFRDRNFSVDLAPFSREAIETFLKIEEPQEPPPEIELFEIRLDVPGLTIGSFYRRIIARLEELERLNPGHVFTGKPSLQLHPDYYWSSGGTLIAVSNLETAKAALNTIISQGEGAWAKLKGAAFFGEPLKMGHYYRFKEIQCARHYLPEDDPAEPTGLAMNVDYGAVYPIKVNPRSDDYMPDTELAERNRAFNRRYTAMMEQIEEALNGNPKSLYTAIMNGMHGLTPIAHEMMKLTIPGDPQNRCGCPTFEWVDGEKL